MKRFLTAALCIGLIGSALPVDAAQPAVDILNAPTVRPTPEVLQLEKKWDKVFKRNYQVNHRKVTFVNRYGITLAADLYEPNHYTGKLPAIAVAGPFGAVKE